MDWVTKWKALQALDYYICLRLDVNHNWYVDSNLEIGGDGFLRSFGEHRRTPEEAISATWRKVLELEEEQYLVSNAMKKGERKHWIWQDFLWRDVTEETRKETA